MTLGRSVLRHLEGLNEAEMADVLGVAPGTVKSCVPGRPVRPLRRALAGHQARRVRADLDGIRTGRLTAQARDRA